MSWLTVPEVAAELRVSVEHVRRSIRRGDLLAVNLATSGRPTYRISQSALDGFLEARRTS
ncbi:excisionase family DNA binding protein [Kribbella rubisoli]|uniref:Excisionase family DNA binding protein n=1 Tax=Kribbella rubisoli TaxID=3075929 RepID=A0A4Q7X364_9ACTN|nr:helix-turn-helix domain-containing protein [Kribbella rubisoli]RZU16419.1 excisionase family DNA binding protein [Kribbella rubisoli]